MPAFPLRRTLSLSVAATLTFALAACGSDSDDAPDAGSDDNSSAASGKTIALINGVLTGDESVCAFSGAKHRLDEDGVEWVESTSAYDVEDELANVNAAIAQGVDMIFIWSAFPDSAAAEYRAAQAADIPLYLFFNQSESVADDVLGGAYYDFKGAGEAAGTWLTENKPDASIIELTGSLGSGTAEASSAGLDEAIEGSGVTLAARQDAQWSADEASKYASSLIPSNPDVSVIVTPNDAMALSVLRTVSKMDDADEISVISTSVSNPDGIAAIEDGSLPYPGYDPLAQYGDQAMTAALDLLDGGDSERSMFFSPATVDASDPSSLAFCYDEYS